MLTTGNVRALRNHADDVVLATGERARPRHADCDLRSRVTKAGDILQIPRKTLHDTFNPPPPP